jgi:hypothetical protein
MNELFPVNKYQVAFNHVSVSENHVSIARTLPLVAVAGK